MSQRRSWPARRLDRRAVYRPAQPSWVLLSRRPVARTASQGTTTRFAAATPTDTHAVTATASTVTLAAASETDTHAAVAAATVTDFAASAETDTHAVTAAASVTDLAEASETDTHVVTATATATDFAEASGTDTHAVVATGAVTDFADASETDTHAVTADATTQVIHEADADETDSHAATATASLEAVVAATPTDTHAVTASETVIDLADADETDTHAVTATAASTKPVDSSEADTHDVSAAATVVDLADASETDVHAAVAVDALTLFAATSETDTHAVTATISTAVEIAATVTDTYAVVATAETALGVAATVTDTHAATAELTREVGIDNETTSTTTITSGYDTDWTDLGTGDVTRNATDVDIAVEWDEYVSVRSPEYAWSALGVPAGSAPTQVDVQYDVTVTRHVDLARAAVEWQHGNGAWDSGTLHSIPAGGVTPSQTLTDGFDTTLHIGAYVEVNSGLKIPFLGDFDTWVGGKPDFRFNTTDFPGHVYLRNGDADGYLRGGMAPGNVSLADSTAIASVDTVTANDNYDRGGGIIIGRSTSDLNYPRYFGHVYDNGVKLAGIFYNGGNGWGGYMNGSVSLTQYPVYLKVIVTDSGLKATFQYSYDLINWNTYATDVVLKGSAPTTETYTRVGFGMAEESTYAADYVLYDGWSQDW